MELAKVSECHCQIGKVFEALGQISNVGEDLGSIKKVLKALVNQKEVLLAFEEMINFLFSLCGPGLFHRQWGKKQIFYCSLERCQ